MKALVVTDCFYDVFLWWYLALLYVNEYACEGTIGLETHNLMCEALYKYRHQASS